MERLEEISQLSTESNKLLCIIVLSTYAFKYEKISKIKILDV